MYVDVARDFVGVVFHVFFSWWCQGLSKPPGPLLFEPHIRSTSISKSLEIFAKLFRGFDWGVGIEGYSHVNEKGGFVLLVL